MSKKKAKEGKITSMLAAAKYLRGRGYAVSHTTIANHLKKGLILKKNGEFLKEDLDRYAKTLPRQKTGIREQDERHLSLREKKLLVEIEIKEELAKKERRKNEILEGKYIPRAEADRRLAAACGVLESGLKYFFRLKAQEIIELVDGDQRHSAELISFLRDQLDIELTRFARAGKVDVEIDVEEVK